MGRQHGLQAQVKTFIANKSGIYKFKFQLVNVMDGQIDVNLMKICIEKLGMVFNVFSVEETGCPEIF